MKEKEQSEIINENEQFTKNPEDQEEDEEKIRLINNENQEQLDNSSTESSEAKPFSIGPKQLEALMTKYKERSESFKDIEYLEELGGVENILLKLETSKDKGISSTQKREEFFGSNKIFIEPPHSFCSFFLEALNDTMIKILIVAAIIEILISFYYIFSVKDNENIEWLDGVSILTAVAAVVLVGSITNYRKERKFQELNKYQNEETKYSIIRNGQLVSLMSEELLVGDLILLNYGEILPADILLIEGNGMKIDESSLSGESHPVKKEIFEKCVKEIKKKNPHPPSNLLLSGTNIIEGNGKGIIIAIGNYSQKGIIKRTVDNAQEYSKTPFEEKIDRIAEIIGWFGLAAAVMTLIPLSIRLGIEYYNKKKNGEEISWVEIFQGILKNIILCVSVIVAAVPEGLPLAVTLSLAFSINKLMENKNLVRKLNSCETMGESNYICTDKTGTLTMNEMKIFNVLTSDNIYEINQNENYGFNSNLFPNKDFRELLKISIALNVDCNIKLLESPNENGMFEEAETKNKTDKAFIDFLYESKVSINKERESFLSQKTEEINTDSSIDQNEIYKTIPFDSQKKRMTTLIKNKNFPSGYRLFTKGAAENVTEFCTKYIDRSTAKVSNLSHKQKEYISQNIQEMNTKMLRTLYICYKDITKEEFENYDKPDDENIYIDQKNLTFIAIFSLKDSLRYGVKEAILKCQQASVKVIMVTGDNIITATSIAKECNILGNQVDIDNLSKKDIEFDPWKMNSSEYMDSHIYELIAMKPMAITGNSFYKIIEGTYCETCGENSSSCQCPKTEAEALELSKKTNTPPKKIRKDVVKNLNNFKIITKNLKILARSQPIHKYALVVGLKQLDSVVAVTGDGTNDAPALSKSDVGFSMFAGTDIAKEASDIIILDNNFSSLIIAIIYGRNIYNNIRKFIQFQLIINFGICILIFISSCLGAETPLTSTQILWVNIIMDSLASLALATEQPYNELLHTKPNKRKESIINALMWKHIILQTLFLLSITIYVTLYGPKFIKENNQNILEAQKNILLCFGQLPGGLGDSALGNILTGNRNLWYNNVFIKAGVLANHNMMSKCELFLDEDDPLQTTLSTAYTNFYTEFGNTTHTTIVFNIFVLYILFNQFNCRIVDDSVNIFRRIFKSPLFWIIQIAEFAIQTVFIQFGGQFLHCVVGGLSWIQWGICIGFGVSTLFIDLLIKAIPLEKLITPIIETKNGEEEKEKGDDYREIAIKENEGDETNFKEEAQIVYP